MVLEDIVKSLPPTMKHAAALKLVPTYNVGIMRQHILGGFQIKFWESEGICCTNIDQASAGIFSYPYNLL